MGLQRGLADAIGKIDYMVAEEACVGCGLLHAHPSDDLTSRCALCPCVDALRSVIASLETKLKARMNKYPESLMTVATRRQKEIHAHNEAAAERRHSREKKHVPSRKRQLVLFAALCGRESA